MEALGACSRQGCRKCDKTRSEDGLLPRLGLSEPGLIELAALLINGLRRSLKIEFYPCSPVSAILKPKRKRKNSHADRLRMAPLNMAPQCKSLRGSGSGVIHSIETLKNSPQRPRCGFLAPLPERLKSSCCTVFRPGLLFPHCCLRPGRYND